MPLLELVVDCAAGVREIIDYALRFPDRAVGLERRNVDFRVSGEIELAFADRNAMHAHEAFGDDLGCVGPPIAVRVPQGDGVSGTIGVPP